MKWIEAKVIYQGRDMALGTELIANAFDELGIQGVVMEDPDLAPAEGWGADSLGPPLHHSVAGYMVDNESRPGRCQRLEAALAKLAEPLALHYQILQEEAYCLERYGDAYRQYMEKVPRYAIAF